MLHRKALVRKDVSKELRASFIRVTRIGELGTTTLAVTSNRRTLRFPLSIVGDQEDRRERRSPQAGGRLTRTAGTSVSLMYGWAVMDILLSESPQRFRLRATHMRNARKTGTSSTRMIYTDLHATADM
jgi:hypothetical protein